MRRARGRLRFLLMLLQLLSFKACANPTVLLSISIKTKNNFQTLTVLIKRAFKQLYFSTLIYKVLVAKCQKNLHLLNMRILISRLLL